jgi:subtilisin
VNKCLMDQIRIGISFLFFTVLLFSCSDSTQTTIPPTTPTTITSVQITSTVLNPTSGGKITIALSVYGTGQFSKAVTWSTVPSLGSFSTASDQGVDYTAPNVSSETQVTIRATSVADPSKFGDLILTIKLAIPPSFKISPTWAAYTEQVTADITGINFSSFTLKLIDPITNQFTNLKPNISNNKVLFSVPSTLQVSGGPKRLEVSDGSVTLNTTLNILGEVDSTVIILSVKPEFSEAQVKTKLEPLGLNLRPNSFASLGGSSGICAGSLALVDINNKPLGQTLEILKSQDFAWTADPQALWKADPETLWDRGNFGQSSNLLAPVLEATPTDYGRDVSIGILDTGVDDFLKALQFGKDAKDFTGEGIADLFNVKPFTDTVSNRPYEYHGSLVALMAAGNGYSIANQASILSIKVCDQYGICIASRVAQGLCYALSTQKTNSLILNLSFGGDTPVQLVRNILQIALAPEVGTLVASSMGNEPSENDSGFVNSQAHYPASFDDPSNSDRLNGMLVVGAASLVETRLDQSSWKPP